MPNRIKKNIGEIHPNNILNTLKECLSFNQYDMLVNGLAGALGKNPATIKAYLIGQRPIPLTDFKTLYLKARELNSSITMEGLAFADYEKKPPKQETAAGNHVLYGCDIQTL
jgi:hypothetical protein